MRSFVIFFICIFLLAGCKQKSPEPTVAIKPQGTMRIAISGSIGELFPLNISEFHSAQFSEYMLSPSLLEYTSGFEPSAMLAADWEIADDGRSVVYYLDGQSKWSNGKTVSAGDILFTWDVIRKLPESSVLRQRLDLIENIVVPDSLTIRISFKEKVSDPLLSSKMPILPKIWADVPPDQLSEKYYKEFTGCGPFLLESISKDSLVLKANPMAEKLRPHIDTLVVFFAESPDEMINMLRRKHIDMAVDIPISNAAEFNNNPDYDLRTYPERGYTMLAWNLAHPLLSELNVRRALSMAIDRETLVVGVLAGYGTVINGPVYPSAQIKPEISTSGYDQDAAAISLGKLGWTKIQNGRWLAKNGKMLEFTILINRENPLRKELAVNIKANLANIGVNVKIEETGWQDYLRRIRSKQYDATLLTWVDGDQYDPTGLFHSTEDESSLNIMGYDNPLADTYLEQGLNEADHQKRALAWKNFQKILAADMPVTFLFNQKVLTVIKKNVINVQLDGRGYLRGVKDWQLKIR